MHEWFHMFDFEQDPTEVTEFSWINKTNTRILRAPNLPDAIDKRLID